VDRLQDAFAREASQLAAEYWYEYYPEK